MRRRAAWSALVLGGALIVGSGRAEAYVRTRDNGGNAFYWKESCVPATLYTHGFETMSGGLPLDQIVKSVAAAAHAWSPDAVTCPGTTNGHPNIEIVPTLAAAGAKPPTIAWDSRNVIVIRTDNWSKSGDPDPSVLPYNPEALALTLVTARGKGHIVDADIEVNAITQSWIDLDPGVTVSGGQSTIEPHDLQNALTHEFGHFLGLDHTCFNEQLGKTRPEDDMGKKVPDCADAPADVAMTVMFDRAIPLQTSKRFLSDDDKRAVCEIYDDPPTPGSCALDEPSDGCAVAPGAATGAWAALAAAALALVAARRGGRARR